MHSINGNNIYLTRGDSLIIELSLSKNGEPYTPEAGSKIRFAMKERYSDSDNRAKLVKNVPINTLVLEILPDDTKKLTMNKKYVYDFQFTDENGRVDTFISGTFTIGEEVL